MDIVIERLNYYFKIVYTKRVHTNTINIIKIEKMNKYIYKNYNEFIKIK